MEKEFKLSPKKGAHDVVLQIPAVEEEPSVSNRPGKDQWSNQLRNGSSQGSCYALSPGKFQPSPSASPSSDKPPKIPTDRPLTMRKSLARSEYSKPKSRLIEPTPPDYKNVKLVASQADRASSPSKGSPNLASSPNRAFGFSSNNSKAKEIVKSVPLTPKTPLIEAQEHEEEEDEDENVYKTAILKAGKRATKRKWAVFVLVELVVFLCLMFLLIASLVFEKLKNYRNWGLQLWKWCVLMIVILSGRLVSEVFMSTLVFLIERNFLFKKKVLYFVYGLRKSVQAFLWLGLILLAWVLLFNHGVKRSRHTTEILDYVTRAIVGCLVGSAIWLLKTFLIKLLASKFHVNRFFDRIQESIFHQYILRALSGPPVMEMGENIDHSNSSPGRLSFTKLTKKNRGKKESVIDVDKLTRMTHGKVSAWTMKGLVDMICHTRLSTLSGALDQTEDEDTLKANEISSEWEAKATAYSIFRNVAGPGSRYIEEYDLLRFLKQDEVDNVIPLFEGASVTRKITRSALKKWVVNVYNERKFLAHSLNDAKTAIEELNKLLSAIVIVVSIIIWLIIMGFLTTQVLVFISSQLLLVVFMFGNTAKTVFEAIIFVFVMHPFDVGDRCVIDGVQMVVEEMNILTTVFLRYDNEKIYYPNSVLAVKPISNFLRSPEMSDTVEFSVDVGTTVETIGLMKSKIKSYLESKPEHWRPAHNLQVKEIENMNKMKMALFVNHTINFQNAPDRGNRKSDLLLEMKKIFEELRVEYHLLPQEVRVSYNSSPSSTAALPSR